jgi:uncharacterized Tic20 family protein
MLDAEGSVALISSPKPLGPVPQCVARCPSSQLPRESNTTKVVLHYSLLFSLIVTFGEILVPLLF